MARKHHKNLDELIVNAIFLEKAKAVSTWKKRAGLQPGIVLSNVACRRQSPPSQGTPAPPHLYNMFGHA